MTQELEKQGSNAIEIVPEHLRNVSGHEGLENASKDDLVIPRLVICQSLHPQRKRDNPLYIPGIEDGDMFNTVTNEVFGRKVEFIPLTYAKNRTLFRELKDGGGILCRSLNGIDGGTISKTCAICPNSQFSESKAPLCTFFMNFPGILIPSRQLLAASYKSTGLKPARQWLTRVNMTNKPMYAAVYEIKSNPAKNAKGEFFVPSFTLKRWTTADEFAFAQSQYESLRGRVIQTDEVHEEEVADESVPF